MKILAVVHALLLFAGISLSQDQENLNFDDCKAYEDSCLCIANVFIDNLSEKKFEQLSNVFLDRIIFRALLPPRLVTSTNSLEATLHYKNWFDVEEPDKYELIDSKADVLVDCLHIFYKIYVTRQGQGYNVEQHLFCEVASGKIHKLSLLCSGPRKIDM